MEKTSNVSNESNYLKHVWPNTGIRNNPINKLSAFPNIHMWTFFPSERFFPWDVLSGDLMSHCPWNVLTPGTFCLRTFWLCTQFLICIYILHNKCILYQKHFWKILFMVFSTVRVYCIRLNLKIAVATRPLEIEIEKDHQNIYLNKIFFGNLLGILA